jgi:hypothetical protein
MHNFTVEKVAEKYVRAASLFKKTKFTIAQKAKIRPIWSPWLNKYFAMLAICSPLTTLSNAPLTVPFQSGRFGQFSPTLFTLSGFFQVQK